MIIVALLYCFHGLADVDFERYIFYPTASRVTSAVLPTDHPPYVTLLSPNGIDLSTLIQRHSHDTAPLTTDCIFKSSVHRFIYYVLRSPSAICHSCQCPAAPVRNCSLKTRHSTISSSCGQRTSNILYQIHSHLIPSKPATCLPVILQATVQPR
jgi:hypothetical protein